MEGLRNTRILADRRNTSPPGCRCYGIPASSRLTSPPRWWGYGTFHRLEYGVPATLTGM